MAGSSTAMTSGCGNLRGHKERHPMRLLLAALLLSTPALADPTVSPDRLRATDARLVAFGTRSTFSEASPAGRGVFAARDWIAAQFRQIAAGTGGRMTVALDEHIQKADGKRVPRDVLVSSVIATLAGDEPGGRTYVMSSHYDSRNTDDADGTRDAPGADDNGSGTAAVIEAARVMAGLHPRATIVFAVYDSEEQGLFGSAHHAQALRASGADVQGDLNNDIVGASVGDRGQKNPGYIRIFSEALPEGADPKRINAIGNENDSPSRELARFAHEIIARDVPGFEGRLVFRADRFLRGGDHESFTAAGFPGIRFTEPVETFAHQHQDVRLQGGVQYGDLMAYMDFDYLAQVTRANIAVLTALAMGPGRPAHAWVSVHDLTNDTTLGWSPVPGATRYEIVRRHTTDAQWTDATDAGTGTTVTVPFSKDDWIFGVRAIDAQGRRGVPTYPLPQR
jgi:Zn-dependent M28 family amino/carboxypeptidase